MRCLLDSFKVCKPRNISQFAGTRNHFLSYVIRFKVSLGGAYYIHWYSISVCNGRLHVPPKSTVCVAELENIYCSIPHMY